MSLVSIGDATNPLAIDNPLYREILARAYAAVANPVTRDPGLSYYHQQEAHLHERLLLSMQRIELELRLRDVLVADYDYTLAKQLELKAAASGKGQAAATA